MSKIKQEEEKLILQLDGPRIRAAEFVSAVREFFSFLKNVADEVAGQSNAIEWNVRAEPGSLCIIAEPEPRNAEPKHVPRTIRAVKSGIRTIETRKKRPRYFTDAALRNISELARLTSVEEDGLNQIKIKAGDSEIQITYRAVAHVKELLGSYRTESGSVEGRLSVVSDRKKFEIYIDDVLTSDSVRCFVDREMQDDILSAFARRVVVTGKVRYRKDGRPTSIEVKEFRVLGRADELPSYQDVKGIYRRSN